MPNKALLLILALGCSLLLTEASFAQNLTAPQVFEKLKPLVGEWKGTTPTGRVFGVSYQLIAKNSVLVETWTMAPGRQTMTVYHLDGNNLLATHYCSAGNQPRLQLKAPAAPDNFVFDFVSSTNLPDPQVSHQHQFDIQLTGPDAFSRSETYLEKGVADTERVAYTRLK